MLSLTFRLTSTSGGMGASYGYNANGNTITVNGLTAYTYDPFNRLVNAGGAAFVISAEDQRLRKLSASDESYYATAPDGTVLAQTQYDGAWSDYVWLNGRAVARVRKGHIYAIYADQTGRPLVVTNSSDSVVWAAKGFAFDRQVTVSGSVADVNLGFPGQWRDDEDGLWHNGYRDYDATTGRYIQSDPIGLAGGVNTYAYVGNNPVSNVDPLGLYASCSCKNGVEHVNIPITFTGAGATPENIQKFTDAIENAWSTSGFVVSVTAGPQNQINIVPGNYGFALTDACVWGNCNGSGTWGGGNPGSLAAHEAGHLMGLPDIYFRLSNGGSAAFPGFENDIMGAWGQPVTPVDRAAVKANLRSCN